MRRKIENDSRYISIITRLRDARENSNLSQSDAARLLNKTQSFVSRSENGLRRIDVLELIEFAEIYNKKVDYFFSEIYSIIK